MKTRKRSMAPAGASLLAILIGGATATAQTPTPPPGKMPQHQESMKGMQGIGGMMVGPHHLLAMAYRDNVATFARALRGEGSYSKVVDLDLARPAVAEMRRSFDQMRQHHQAQIAMMSGHTDSERSEMTQHMETHLAALGEHLTALESEVNGGAPDAMKISEHANAILKQCAEMSARPAKAKPHKMN